MVRWNTSRGEHPRQVLATLTMVAGLAAGDEHQWAAFADRYGPLIKYVGRRHGVPSSDLDELVQIVLVSLHHTICVTGSFRLDPRRGALASYVMVAARNAARNRLQARKHLPLDQDLPIPTRSEQRDVAQWLLATLDELTEKATGTMARDLEIFRRSALEDVSVSELAREYQLDVGRVYGIKSEVRKLLRARFDRDWGARPGRRGGRPYKTNQ